MFWILFFILLKFVLLYPYLIAKQNPMTLTVSTYLLLTVFLKVDGVFGKGLITGFAVILPLPQDYLMLPSS